MKLKIKNYNIILLILLVASTILMGIGYAAINSVTGEINVTVSAEAQKGVFITDIELVSEVDADTGISNINNYIGTTMNSTVALSTTNPNSEIVYKVTVYNRGDQSSTYLGALYDEEFYDNLGIVFEVEGISVEDEIAPKETKEFTIKFKYKDGVIPESNILNSYINFKFGNPNRLMLANQNDGTYLNSGIAREQIENIRFVYGEVPNEGVISSFDASEKGNESIWGYYTDTDGNGMYELTFTSTEPIYTNIDSSFLFYNLNNVKTINFENFSTTGTTKMKAFFYGCNNLTNLNLNKINTSQVTDMSYMFCSCISLTSLDVSKFDTSQATNMKYMFYMCKALTSLDVTKFNTSQVTNMEFMFYGCNLLTSLDVSKFDTSQVINMQAMFYACESLTSLDVSKFNTSQVTNMSGLFYECSLLKNIDLSSFDTSKVTDMSFMFNYCVSLTSLDVSKFNTSNVTNMMLMFESCISLTSIGLSNFDTSNVTSMAAMFEMCFSLTNIDVSNFDTSKVTDMSYMFYQCKGLTNIDISSFNTSNVTNMSRMFSTNPNLKTIYASEYNEETDTGWTTKNVTNSSSMFTGCTSLVGGNGTVFASAHIDKEYARIDKEGQPGYLTNKNLVENRLKASNINDVTYLNSGVEKDKIEDIKFVYGEVPKEGVISQFDASEKQNGSIKGYYTDTDGNGMYELTFASTDTIYANINSSYLFYDLNKLRKITFDNFSTKGTENMSYMFSMLVENDEDVSLLEEIKGLEKFDTSSVNNMEYMFNGLVNISSLNLSSFDTNKVTTMEAMFGACKSLLNLDLSNFNTNKVTTMEGMFWNCTSLTQIDLSNFDTSNVQNMAALFGGNNGNLFGPMKLEEIIGLENFDTSNVTDMSYMFQGCKNLRTIKIENFNTSKVTDMSYMFFNCESISNIDLSNFDTSQAITLEAMFSGCISVKDLDVTKFDTRNVTNMEEMFCYCKELTSIDVSNFNTENVSKMDYMFSGDNNTGYMKLKEIKGLENFDTSKVTLMYAMFWNCPELIQLDLSNFNTSKVTDMSKMFGCNGTAMKLEKIYVSEYDESTNTGWTTKSVTNSTNMFANCVNLVGGNGTVFDSAHIDKEYARIDKEGQPGYLTNKNQKINRLMFADSNYTTYLNSGVTKDKIEEIKFVYGEVPSEGVISQFDASEKQDGSITGYYTDTDGNEMYELTFASTETIYANINSSNLFLAIGNMKNITFDNFSTKGTTNMQGMFLYCINLTRLDLSNFDTSDVTNMNVMIGDCINLVEIDLNNFDTSNVVSMDFMFEQCYSLKTIDLSGFNTSKVNSMQGMFTMLEGRGYISNLKTIYVSEYDESTGKGWTTKNVTNLSSMFTGCTSLVGGNGTEYSSSHIDATYARIDTVETPGYFTNINNKQ